MTPAAIVPDDFPWFDASRYTFSLGLTDGSHTYVSGHSASAYDPAVGRIVVLGDLAAQTGTAYDKIERILDAAGLGLGDVHRLVEHVTVDALDHTAEVARVRDRRLPADAEVAISTVAVRSLLRADAQVELEVDAGPAGDLVHLGGCLPVDQGGRLVGTGDLRAQAEAVLAVAARRAAAAGLDLDHIVKVTEVVTPAGAAHLDASAAARRELLGGVLPAVTTVVQPAIAGAPGAWLSAEVVAARRSPQLVDLGERAATVAASRGASLALRVGDVVLLSGGTLLVAATRADEVARPDVSGRSGVGAQADAIYRAIDTVLRAAGGGVRDLVRTVESVTPAGLPRYRDVAAVRQRRLAAPWPASTGIVCEALADPAALLEVDAQAVLGGGR